MGKRWEIFVVENREALINIRTWKGVLAEIIGTSILVAIGCGSCIGQDWETNTPTTVQIAFTFGLTLATMVTCIGHVSGGHINPAVTIATVVTRRIPLMKGFLYVKAQLVGAVIGSATLKAITPPAFEGDLGQTTVSSELRPFPDAIVVEGLIAFILVFTVYASGDGGRNDLKGSAPLAVGLCTVFCHLFAIKYTGSCMNPARSFGPAVIGGNWENHWVYWVGPVLGALAAGLSYEFVFASNSSRTKMKNFLVDPKYGHDESCQQNVEEDASHTTVDSFKSTPPPDFRLQSVCKS